MAWREQALCLRDCEDFREFTEKMLRSLKNMFDFLIVYDILKMFLGLYLILEVLMSADFKKFMSTSKYFSGSAENEETFIKNVFCPQLSIRKLVSIDSSAPKILVGQKGTGKSAFLKFYKNILEENGFPVIFIRPSDIEYKFSQDNSLGGVDKVCKRIISRSDWL